LRFFKIKKIFLKNFFIQIKDAIGAKELEAFPGRIEFCNVSFAYKTGHPVLSNLSFTVDPGQTIALVFFKFF